MTRLWQNDINFHRKNYKHKVDINIESKSNSLCVFINTELWNKITRACLTKLHLIKVNKLYCGLKT